MTSKIITFLVNVIVLALPIAILEITLEKNTGWGSSFPKNKWYGKVIGENSKIIRAIVKLLGLPYFFGYLVFMYFFVLPIILISEYLTIIPNAALLLAVYFAILITEDFLWFLMNWNFNSLEELLKGPTGKIWWHKRWVKIYKNKYLPMSYFIAIPFILFFLLIS
jgi:hypothetical protein